MSLAADRQLQSLLDPLQQLNSLLSLPPLPNLFNLTPQLGDPGALAKQEAPVLQQIPSPLGVQKKQQPVDSV